MNMMLTFKSAFFQSAYTYWLCSIRLPLYLRHKDTGKEHKVEACQEVCQQACLEACQKKKKKGYKNTM